MTIEEKIKWVMDELSCVYCSNCGAKKDDCDECHRKNMNWSMGETTARKIVKKLTSK